MGEAARTIDPETNFQRVHDRLDTRLKSEKLRLPLLPRVTTEILQMCNDPDRGVSDLARVIRTDAALGAHVLRVANSAAYGVTVEIVSLRQALQRLGLDTIANIATAAALESSLYKQSLYADELRQSWRSSLASGFFAKEISRALRRDVESAFLCGLLRDIGRPIIFQQVAEILTEMSLGSLDDHAHITTLLDIFQRTAGSMLGQKWGLPLTIQSCISSADDSDPKGPHADDIRIARLSSAFANHLLDPERVTDEALRASKDAVALNLYPESVDELVDRGEDILTALEAMSG